MTVVECKNCSRKKEFAEDEWHAKFVCSEELLAPLEHKFKYMLNMDGRGSKNKRSALLEQYEREYKEMMKNHGRLAKSIEPPIPPNRPRLFKCYSCGSRIKMENGAYIRFCESCSEVNLAAVDPGFKYAKVVCPCTPNGIYYRRELENKTSIECEACSKTYFIEDKVRGKECGRNIYLTYSNDPSVDETTMAPSEDMEVTKQKEAQLVEDEKKEETNKYIEPASETPKIEKCHAYVKLVCPCSNNPIYHMKYSTTTSLECGACSETHFIEDKVEGKLFGKEVFLTYTEAMGRRQTESTRILKLDEQQNVEDKLVSEAKEATKEEEAMKPSDDQVINEQEKMKKMKEENKGKREPETDIIARLMNKCDEWENTETSFWETCSRLLNGGKSLLRRLTEETVKVVEEEKKENHKTPEETTLENVIAELQQVNLRVSTENEALKKENNTLRASLQYQSSTSEVLTRRAGEMSLKVQETEKELQYLERSHKMDLEVEKKRQEELMAKDKQIENLVQEEERLKSDIRELKKDIANLDVLSISQAYKLKVKTAEAAEVKEEMEALRAVNNQLNEFNILSMQKINELKGRNSQIEKQLKKLLDEKIMAML